MFLKMVGANAFIKQYFTHKVMKSLYPNNIRFVKYEDLVRNPAEIFAENLAFLGHDVTAVEHQDKFSMALQLSSIESIRSIESAMGHSLANDQVDSQSSHVKDGAIGKWKAFFRGEDIAYLEERFGEYNIAMDEFTFE